MTRVIVWDLPVRLFHWLLAASVLTAYLTAEAEGALAQVHVSAGYAIAGLLIFRVIWGVLGSRHARFADFARNLRQLPAYLPKLAQLKPPRFVGHNPVGVVMILAMTATLVGVLSTGLFGGGEELHETFGNLIIVLAGLHVLGVLLESVIGRENLVAAMIHGRKTLDADAACSEGRPAGPVRAAGALVATVLVAVAAIQASPALTWPPSIPEGLEEHEGEDHDEPYEEGDETDHD
jgi:cytochrome b